MCKDLESDLDRLWNEAIGVKQLIISVYKKATHNDKEKEGKQTGLVDEKKEVKQKDTKESLVI